jgi:polyisoprenoid-binding protein YceI
MKASYLINKNHSEVKFRVKWMGLTFVTGYFLNFDVTANTPIENGKDVIEDMEVDVILYVDSIDTGNSERDEHLKSEDFFAAEQIPHICFIKEGKAKYISEDVYEIIGRFIMYGISVDIPLIVEFFRNEDNTQVCVIAKGTIKRSDFNIVNYTPGGAAHDSIISNDVEIVGRFHFDRVELNN